MAANVAGYRAEGYRRFQLKVGGNPDEDIERIRAVRAILEPGDKLVADANTGWLMHEAARVVDRRRRRGRVHRAAVRRRTRVPGDSPAHAVAICAGRGASIRST